METSIQEGVFLFPITILSLLKKGNYSLIAWWKEAKRYPFRVLVLNIFFLSWIIFHLRKWKQEKIYGRGNSITWIDKEEVTLLSKWLWRRTASTNWFASKETKWITFVCVNWIGRQRKPKNILTRRTWCEKDFLKRLLFLFFCDSIPPASPAMSSNNKKFFDGQKKFSVKKFYWHRIFWDMRIFWRFEKFWQLRIFRWRKF